VVRLGRFLGLGSIGILPVRTGQRPMLPENSTGTGHQEQEGRPGEGKAPAELSIARTAAFMPRFRRSSEARMNAGYLSLDAEFLSRHAGAGQRRDGRSDADWE